MDGELKSQVSGTTEELSASSPSDLSTKVREKEDLGSGHGSVVAAYYNNQEEQGLNSRSKSRILYLRNLNNWIKSMLIAEYLEKVRQSKTYGAAIRVLDIGCGKGGDLFKWKHGNINHLICADIAATSVEQCKNRYNELRAQNESERRYVSPLFTAEFYAVDCTKERLRECYRDPSISLDLVSCQFAFHYCFESYSQAELMLRNASECLRPGGFFIGTLPDANEIMMRWQRSDYKSFGNDIYNIEFLDATMPPPLFGAKYNFHLEGVVDCPEFLVHFPTLEKLAKKFDLQLVAKERFEDLFSRMTREEGKFLLSKMHALETYPPLLKVPLVGKDPEDYEHVQQYLQTAVGHRKVGTLSKAEWEVATLYMVFAFQKKSVQK